LFGGMRVRLLELRQDIAEGFGWLVRGSWRSALYLRIVRQRTWLGHETCIYIVT
jgi:hypothetical protein